MHRLNRHLVTSSACGADDNPDQGPARPAPSDALALLQRHQIPIPEQREPATDCVFRFLDGQDLDAQQCRELDRYLQNQGVPQNVDLLCGIQALAPRFIPTLDLMAKAPPGTPFHQADEHVIDLLHQAQDKGLACAVRVTHELTLAVAQAIQIAMSAERSHITGFVYPSARAPTCEDVASCLRKALGNNKNLSLVQAQPGVLTLLERSVDTLVLTVAHKHPIDQHSFRVLEAGGTRHLRVISDIPEWCQGLIERVARCNARLEPPLRVQSVMLQTYSRCRSVVDTDRLHALLCRLFSTPGVTSVGLPDARWLNVFKPRVFANLVAQQGLLHLYVDKQPLSEVLSAWTPTHMSTDDERQLRHMLEFAETSMKRNRQRLQALLPPLAHRFWQMATAQYRSNFNVGELLRVSAHLDLPPMRDAIMVVEDPAMVWTLSCLDKNTQQLATGFRCHFAAEQPVPHFSKLPPLAWKEAEKKRRKEICGPPDPSPPSRCSVQ